MMVSLKYAVVERERRFLVSKLPGVAHERRRIMDRYREPKYTGCGCARWRPKTAP